MMILEFLLGDSIGRFSLMEIAWTATALFAMRAAWLNRTESRAALAAMQPGDPESMLVIARGHVRRETTRLIVASAFAVFGFLAGQTPASPVLTYTGLVISAGLVTTSALLARDSVRDRHDRHWLENLRSTASTDRLSRAGERTADATERIADANERQNEVG